MTSAEVVSVYPNRIKISVGDINDLMIDGEPAGVGSYLKIYDVSECCIIAIIDSYSIELKPVHPAEEDKAREKVFIIEAIPLGFLDADGNFERGGGKIAIPPKTVEVAGKAEIRRIYDAVPQERRFTFAYLAQDPSVEVPVDGDRFFNKHIAVVGSTGSGKSHAITRLIQNATEIGEKSNSSYKLNNSHIIIFDIHSEYRSAFPDANYLNVESLVLPYWLLSSEELQDLFIESNEEQSHNQISVLKRTVTENRRKHFDGDEKLRGRLHYDSPVFFDIDEVLADIRAVNEQMIPGQRGDKQGPLYGKLENFITRLENKITDIRLGFLLGEEAKKPTLEQTLRQFIGYEDSNFANVTIIDVSGVPFEVLSITVSLISRLLFDYAYYHKKTHPESKNDTPILVVYEEAHKYVPKSSLARYSASRYAIERIAKEGRKYGITAAIISQRPAEISETIFSQCNNFLAMRLTNPEDQSYVRRLLPDSLGTVTESLPTLSAGEALLIGDAVVMPSVVKLDDADPPPSSSDIRYLQEWKRPWYEMAFKAILDSWQE
jgi:hypothetical protein